MYKVAIVGAGVGGSYLSYLLARNGVDTVVFDFRAPHDKLCAGGISYKAMAKFPVLEELPCPRKVVWKSAIISPNDRMTVMDLEKPLTIFKRRDLDSALLRKAQESGAHFRKERVRSFALEGDRWRIFTEAGEYRAENLVGADGALSRTRKKLQSPLDKGEYFFAFQCFLGVQRDFVAFKFFPDLEGYLWAFPRVDSLAVGIVAKECTREKYSDMKERLFCFIETHYPGQTKRICIRGAYIPFFSPKDFYEQSICSKNWALIGDAARFVDPIGGEGIYYAIYSAEILAACIQENNLPLYQRLCRKHFGRNLLKASQGFDYIHKTGFIETMAILAENSTAIRQIISEMIVGNIDYLTWKRRLRKKLVRIVADFMFNADFATKKEVMTNFVSLWYPRLGPYSKPKIS
ncbi:MAG: NAD(P)/FAD-dependent oxidoreductase [Proteobacteria bacterium]|jgi:geranylgeranyl reductase family protein|nr:NAD(P)/FAD-dependent oxidoreductase [Pseudomonadota bacterium]